MANMTSAELHRLITRVLKRAGAAPGVAKVTADALVAADMEGLSGHGCSRAGLYVEHLRTGRVDGRAKPVVIRRKGGTCIVDAGGGLAFPAAALAMKELIKRSRRNGVAFVGVTNSHHFGAAAYHLAAVAEAGLIGLAFSNSPPAINAWGGRRAVFGTNPIAAAFPRRDAPPITIDLALTEVVRGKIMLYAKEGKPIPEGWALDRDGNPTTDAKAALTGSLAAIGGMKGAMLAFMVEMLCVATTGAAFAYENDSFFEPGNKPRIGHAFFALDPAALGGLDIYQQRVEDLVTHLADDPGVRLPGARRHASAERTRDGGVDIPDALLAELRALAA